MNRGKTSSDLGGFTLVEALVATTVITIAFAALGIASVALQKSFFSARDYSAGRISCAARVAPCLEQESL